MKSLTIVDVPYDYMATSILMEACLLEYVDEYFDKKTIRTYTKIVMASQSGTGAKRVWNL